MTMSRVANTENTDSSWSWLYNISGVAALMAGILLLIAMVSLITAVLQLGATNGWLSSFQNNWLIVIFKMHAGFGGAHIQLLHVLDGLDIAILALVGTMFLGLYVILKRTSRIWPIIAAVQPFLGMVLFIATKTAGRSGVMGAGLVISVVLLRSNIFEKVIACVGILAALLLLVGDFTSGIIPPSAIMAALFGVGYVLFITWLFMIAGRLFQLGRVS